MEMKTLNRGDSQKAMAEWIENYPTLPSVDDSYVSIRNDLQEMNRQVRQDAENNASGKRSDNYYIDAHMGLALYKYLWEKPGFTLRTAADDGFWRYLSVKVVPDIVSQRWGRDNNDHFWSKPTRIWLRSIWWYVHLSWQGSYDSTKELLESPHFTTDTILNFEERNGRRGTCVEAYRYIIYFYSKVPETVLKQFTRGKSGNSDDLFRVVMKLNTAKMMVMEPALCLGGEREYARTLFKDAGVVISDT